MTAMNFFEVFKVLYNSYLIYSTHKGMHYNLIQQGYLEEGNKFRIFRNRCKNL
jgi:hypothetical protein